MVPAQLTSQWAMAGSQGRHSCGAVQCSVQVPTLPQGCPPPPCPSPSTPQGALRTLPLLPTPPGTRQAGKSTVVCSCSNLLGFPACCPPRLCLVSPQYTTSPQIHSSCAPPANNVPVLPPLPPASQAGPTVGGTLLIHMNIDRHSHTHRHVDTLTHTHADMHAHAHTHTLC